MRGPWLNPIAVVPVFNEAATIGPVVAQVRAHLPVIVVDDGSDDRGGLRAAAAGAEVLRHHWRRGKADALRTGIATARARGASHVVTLDGDGQHDPRDLPRLLTAAREDPTAIIVGGRLHGHASFPRGRFAALCVTGFFVEWVTGLGVRDTQSGYRVYPLPLFDDVPTRRRGFVFETEVLVAAAARGWRAREVGVQPRPLAARPSRFRPLVDGAAIAAYLAGPVLRHPRRGRVIGTAVAAAPLVLVAGVLTALLGRRAPDLAAPLVRRVYRTERLADRAPLRPGPVGPRAPLPETPVLPS